MENSRSAFSVVAIASSAALIPLISASTRAVSTTKAGSLRLPRWGDGRKEGRVGFDQHALQRHVAGDLAQIFGVLEGHDAGKGNIEAELQRRFGERAARW